MVGMDPNGSPICRSIGKIFAVPMPIMTAQYPDCRTNNNNPISWMSGCIGAANLYCMRSGYVGGSAVAYDGFNLGVLCIGLN